MVAKDLLVYFAFCALPSAAFLLSSYPDTQFYISLFVVSSLVMLWFRVYFKDSGLLQYDQNLVSVSLAMVLAGIVSCLVVATYMVTNYTAPTAGQWVSSIYVPSATLGLSVGQFTIPSAWSDVLFTLTLVVPAEECGKLVTQLGMYTWLKDALAGSVAKAISIVTPIIVWGLLHTYRNPAYQGQYMMVMVATAIIAGLVMYAVMWKTKSLLAAILVHVGYNVAVLYLSTQLV